MAMTSKEKSAKRRAEMQAAAERNGFENASEAITAWKQGEYELVKYTDFMVMREAEKLVRQFEKEQGVTLAEYLKNSSTVQDAEYQQDYE